MEPQKQKKRQYLEVLSTFRKNQAKKRVPQNPEPAEDSSDNPIANWLKERAPEFIADAYVKIAEITGDVFELPSTDILQSMGLKELRSLKTSSKEQLKLYDVQFEDTFGRPPVKQEKEPIREIYAFYKRVRKILDEREAGLLNDETSKQIEDMTKERTELKEVIASYQKEFKQVNGRGIRNKSDIEPIKEQYTRYKRMKTQMKEIRAKQEE